MNLSSVLLRESIGQIPLALEMLPCLDGIPPLRRVWPLLRPHHLFWKWEEQGKSSRAPRKARILLEGLMRVAPSFRGRRGKSQRRSPMLTTEGEKISGSQGLHRLWHHWRPPPLVITDGRRIATPRRAAKEPSPHPDELMRLQSQAQALGVRFHRFIREGDVLRFVSLRL
jgi:hypothetical protein